MPSELDRPAPRYPASERRRPAMGRRRTAAPHSGGRIRADRLSGLPERLAEAKQERQHDVARAAQAFGQLAVGVQPASASPSTPPISASCSWPCGAQQAVQLAQLVDVGQPGVDLRLGEEHRRSRSLWPARPQSFWIRLGVHVARPGPAPDVGNAGVVDGDDGDIARSGCGWTHARPGRRPCARGCLTRSARRQQENRERHDQPEEPVGLPEILTCPSSRTTTRLRLSGTHRFDSGIRLFSR